MQGEAHWLPLAIVLLGAAAILAGVWIVTWSARSVRLARTAVPCPKHGRDAEIVLITDAKTGHPIGVDTCSLVNGMITCDRACLAAAASAAAPHPVKVTVGVQGPGPVQ
jgi:hypothetical protein